MSTPEPGTATNDPTLERPVVTLDSGRTRTLGPRRGDHG